MDLDLAKVEQKRTHKDGDDPIPPLVVLLAMSDVCIAQSAAEEKYEEGISAKKIKA